MRVIFTYANGGTAEISGRSWEWILREAEGRAAYAKTEIVGWDIIEE